MPITILIISLFLLIGCAGVQPPKVGEVKVDMTSLGGKWEGEYVSTATQRNGKISFDLSSSTTEAKGAVSMTQKKRKSTGEKFPAKARHDRSVMLPIEFVAIEDGKVSGKVKPYQDPRFGGRTMFTTFVGTVEGNTMKGTFMVEIGQSGESYTGTWWVARQ